MKEYDAKKALEIITPEFLEAWAAWEVNDVSALMSREDQQIIKDMAIKILKERTDEQA